MEGKATLKLRSPQSDNVQHLYHENYDVIHCEYTLHKEKNSKGEVNSDVKAGNILVALPMLPNDSIMSWVFDSSKKYNGEITIHDAFEESLEKIYFEEGRPVGFRLHYEPSENGHVVLLLTINARRLVIGNSEFINKKK